MKEPESTNRRVISLIDMDCFYVQCEQRLCPETWGMPCAVAQYNNWTGGGLIAVNYQARPFGVKRGMRNTEAKNRCPELHIFIVPERNGKADLTRYREASGEVFDTITNYINKLEAQLGKRGLIVLERASIDEAFIDLTDYVNYDNAKPLELPEIKDFESFNTKLVFDELSFEDWLQSNQKGTSFADPHKRLLIGAFFIGNIRKHIFEKTQFRCSAGISHNKMLSKLACGVNKPNAQTILPLEGVPKYFQNIRISEVRSLGGQFGEHIQSSLNVTTMGQLQKINKATLLEHFDAKTAEWLASYSQGYDYSTVTKRSLPSSIGCSKNFPNHLALATMTDIEHWVQVLCEEVHDRIESDRLMNKRVAQQLVIGHNTTSGQHTKAMNINLVGGKYPPPEQMAKMIIKTVFSDQDAQKNSIININLNITKFGKSLENFPTIRNFFVKVDRSASKDTDEALSSEIIVSLASDTIDDQKDSEQTIEESDFDKEDYQDSDLVDNENDDEEVDEEPDEEKDCILYCNCENSEISNETSLDQESEHGDDNSETVFDDEFEDMITYKDLPPERIKKITKSFFYRKALQLYNFDQIDSDSDLASYPDDDEEEELLKLPQDKESSTDSNSKRARIEPETQGNI